MEKMFYLLERIYRMTHIPVLYLDKTGGFTLLNFGYDSKDNPLITDEVLYKLIMDRLLSTQDPIIEFEEKILYGACKDSMDNIIILAPVSDFSVTTDFLKQYMHQHKIKSDTFHILK